MRRQQAWLAGFAALLSSGLATPAAAYIRVDDFRDAQGLSLPGAEDAASDAAIAPSVLAGERDLVLRRLGGVATDVEADVALVGVERLVLENPGAAELALELVYDGADGDPETVNPSGLGDVNLTEPGTGDGFAVRMRADAETVLTLQAFDNGDPTGGTWSAGSVVVPASSLRWRFVPRSALLEPGPNGLADLRDVGAIALRLTGAPTSVAIDEIRVPEPGAAAGALAVSCALAALRRARR